MGDAQDKKKGGLSRGLLSRPLDSLVFLLPLIACYEVSSFTARDRVIASDLLRRFVELFGPAGMWAPGIVVVVILLATHMASGERWRVHWRRVGLMYLEVVLLASPLLVLNWTLPMIGGGPLEKDMFHRIAMGLGAGVYEEMVFRLILISLLVMVGTDLFHLERMPVAVASVLASALLFAGHHHKPFGAEAFAISPFLFRSLAGVYLSVIFWYRGYGSAAGCHAAYNVAIVLMTD